MTQEMCHAMRSDRLDLTDLLEVSDFLLRSRAFRLRVASWSMYPTLCKGDGLTVEPVSPRQLQVGDLVLLQVRFPQGPRLVCHRLVEVDETRGDLQLITKGDAVTGCGETIKPDQVLGKVVAVARRWPLPHSGRWVGALAKRVDQAMERFTLLIAQGLLALQGLRSYRWMMRALLSHGVAYYVGLPEGRRWFRYHRIGGRRPPGALACHQRFHLLAKLAGICVGSLQVTASGEDYWIEGVYVRIRFRGFGVASQLLALAAAPASRSRPAVLLASVEPANTAALHLFIKAGFRNIGVLCGNHISLRRDL